MSLKLKINVTKEILLSDKECSNPDFLRGQRDARRRFHLTPLRYFTNLAYLAGEHSVQEYGNSFDINFHLKKRDNHLRGEELLRKALRKWKPLRKKKKVSRRK